MSSRAPEAFPTPKHPRKKCFILQFSGSSTVKPQKIDCFTSEAKAKRAAKDWTAYYHGKYRPPAKRKRR